MGLCTKRRPWSNLFINANLVAPCFCFGRESCSSLFQVISSDFKTISTGSSFCTFGGVMYKTKTLVKFVHKRKSCCSLFLFGRESCSSLFQVISSDFKTISTGSSFCTFRGVMYKTKTLVKFVHKRKSCCSLFLLWSRIMFQPFSSDFK